MNNSNYLKVINNKASTASLLLTSRWHCVLKHLIELSEVHDHGEFVGLNHRRHLLASHAGRDAKFLLCHVESQLVVPLVVLLIQEVEVTEEYKREKNQGGTREKKISLSLIL